MLNKVKNEQGFAIVYGLIVLLLATIAGTGLMFMSRQGHVGATDYAKIRSASQAALAALKAFEGQFTNNPNTALAILNQYKADNSYNWLFGDETNSNTEQRIKFQNENNSPEYSARILGFDVSSHLIKIEGTGYGSIGGKKRVVASYRLDGLDQNVTLFPSFTLDHAMFLGGTIENINEPLCIKGDVYLRLNGSNNQAFNNGATINGNLKIAQSSAYLVVGSPLRITGTAFFQCNIMPKAEFIVDGKAGFTGRYDNWDQPIQLFDDAYFISSNNPSKTDMILGQSGKTVTYSNPLQSSLFTGFDTEDQDNSQDENSIAANLGSTTAAELSLGYYIPTWGPGVVQEVAGSLPSTTLENYWLTHEANGTLYQKKWLVCKLTGDVWGDGGPFTRKVIWIVGDYQSFIDDYYVCSSESNNLFIIKDNAKINIRIPDNCIFRGLIYINTANTGNMNYALGDQSVVYGAIHHASQTGFNINSGDADSARIYFTDPLAQSALDEITETGLILPPGAAPPEPTTSDGAIFLVDNKIRPTLLGMQW